MPMKRYSLIVRKVGVDTTATGQGATGTDLKFMANPANARPFIQLLGNDFIFHDITAGNTHQFAVNGEIALAIGDVSTVDGQLITYNNKNIAFVPNGTGKVKFGTYAAGVATESTGYITILDAAGNTRKLMVQA